MADAEFWASTLRQVDARLRIVRDQDRQADLRAGTVASVLANQWRKQGVQPATPADFFPSLKEATVEQTPAGPADHLALLRATSWGTRVVSVGDG